MYVLAYVCAGIAVLVSSWNREVYVAEYFTDLRLLLLTVSPWEYSGSPDGDVDLEATHEAQVSLKGLSKGQITERVNTFHSYFLPL